MNTWLFYHSRYCRPVTHLYISILSSFLNVKFIKLPFSTSCPFHFPYLLLVLLLYPANHQQAGLGLCKASRDNPERKRSNIKLLLCSHVLQVLQSKDVLYQDTLCLYVTPASGVQSVISVGIAFLPLILCQRATLSDSKLTNWGHWEASAWLKSASELSLGSQDSQECRVMLM